MIMKRIGVLSDTHLKGPDALLEEIMNSFKDVDAVIYGHTHEGFSGSQAGIFFFNPGSPTDSRFTIRRSIGIITIHKHTIVGELIPL
jgi:hypothetical protein